jgi:plastocyanin
MRTAQVLRTAASLLAVGLLFSPAGRANIIDVRIQYFQFTGQNLTIQLGDTVRWTNFDSATHSATEGTDFILNGNEAFHHPFPPGSPAASTIFDAAFLAQYPRAGNRYDYFCVPHGSAMTGSITVENGPGSFFCFCSPLGPCSNRDYGAGCVNSTNARGARMTGTGSASVSADDLRLIVDLLPANKIGFVFRGVNPVAQVQVGDGWRCIGGPVYRFRARNSRTAGVIVLGPGIAASTSSGPVSSASVSILPGHTWLFQLWYHDLPSPCGNDSNVSNGYSVTFVP